MKTYYLLCILSLTWLSGRVSGQVLYTNGATLSLTTSATLTVNGSAQLQSGSTLINNGTLALTGDLVNNQTMTAVSAGTLRFAGSAAQTLSGTGQWLASNVHLSNPTGLSLSAPLIIDGNLNLAAGIVTATASTTLLTLTANATVNGASDASHVRGYLVRQGTGSFIYPVGDGTHYQPVTVALSANASGLTARYYAADAGTAPFLTTGASTVPLQRYNEQEYWELTPLSTATGQVTLTWDGVNNPSLSASPNRNIFRVAHKTSAGWLNEGAAAVSGTPSAGSVTSELISNWSPFTLGAVATYQLSGNVLDDGNGLTDNLVNTSGSGALNPVNGTSLDATPLYVTLVDAGNTPQATLPVTASGSYSFSDVVAGSYSVVLSTSATGSLTSSLPDNWIWVGEQLGTTAGSDGTPNGILTGISLVSSDLSAANFGIDKRPTANAVGQSYANPGGQQTVVVPTLRGSDLEDGPYMGAGTTVRITSLPVTSSGVLSGTLTYNGGVVNAGQLITGYNPDLLQYDPEDGAGSYLVGYSTVDAAGVSSATATATLSFSLATDLTPILYALPTIIHGSQPLSVVVDVVELAGMSSTGGITIYVTKDAQANLNFRANEVLVGGRSVTNNAWNFDGSSNAGYYILTTTTVIPAGTKLSFGLQGNLTPGATVGKLTISAVIGGGSGGEVRVNNNADADKIDYFQQ